MPWYSKKNPSFMSYLYIEPNATQLYNVQGCGVVAGYQNASRSTNLGSPGAHSLLDVPRPRSRWPCSPSLIVPTLCRHWSHKWFLWRFLTSDSDLCKEIAWFVQYIDLTTADTHPQPSKRTHFTYEHIYCTFIIRDTDRHIQTIEISHICSYRHAKGVMN